MDSNTILMTIPKSIKFSKLFLEKTLKRMLRLGYSGFCHSKPEDIYVYDIYAMWIPSSLTDPKFDPGQVIGYVFLTGMDGETVITFEGPPIHAYFEGNIQDIYGQVSPFPYDKLKKHLKRKRVTEESFQLQLVEESKKLSVAWNNFIALFTTYVYDKFPESVPPEFLAFVLERGDSESTIEQSDSRGPNIRTIERFRVFEEMKAKNPTYSQSRVAMEVNKQKLLQEIITEDTVRNTYRLMGKKWQRGDRVR